MLEERARIARELHNVVAHHMSMIAVQAETAPYRLAAKPGAAGAPGLPEPVSEEFAALGQAARRPSSRCAASSACCAPLITARSATAPPPPARPPAAPRRHPGTRRRRPPRGRRRQPPDARSRKELPASVGLTAYRIVQESLSNAARHAPGARISVTVEEAPPYVRINVTNGRQATGQPDAGRRPGSPAARGERSERDGLVGMRERVALLGGSCGPVRARRRLCRPRRPPDGRHSRYRRGAMISCLIADDQAMVREGSARCSPPSPTSPSSAWPRTAPRRSGWPRRSGPTWC